MAFKRPLPVKRNIANPVLGHTIAGLATFDKSNIKNMLLIGMGTFGKVYKETIDDETIVMKQICNSDATELEIRLFRKEAELLTSLRGHDNIVQICGFVGDAMLLQYAEFNLRKLAIDHDT
jgi:predicted Ser/Thr protein kinase